MNVPVTPKNEQSKHPVILKKEKASNDKSSVEQGAVVTKHKSREKHRQMLSSKDKNYIEFLGSDAHHQVKWVDPKAKPVPAWDQNKPATYTVSGLRDGRAWLKTSDGTFLTVQQGTILPDGRKITQINDQGVWVNGQPLK